MNYKWHTLISLSVVTAAAAYFISIQSYPPTEILLFLAMGFFNTTCASPDIDHPNSRPTKRMGPIGTITSSLFTHRGILHNPIFWTVLYFGIGLVVYQKYSYEAWWLTGGLVAIYVHVILDETSTKVKRTRTKVKRKLHL